MDRQQLEAAIRDIQAQLGVGRKEAQDILRGIRGIKKGAGVE